MAVFILRTLCVSNKGNRHFFPIELKHPQKVYKVLDYKNACDNNKTFVL